MKHINFTLLLIMLMSMVGVKSFSYDAQIGGIYYNFDKGTATVTYVSSNSYSNRSAYTGDVVIPSSVIYNGNTYSVTSIGRGAFSGCNGLTSITIPTSVTIISDYAFSGCGKLIEITIPNSVTIIGDGAFTSSGIVSVDIPPSITTIGSGAFTNCTSLHKVIVSDIAKWCSISFKDYLSNPLVYAHRLYSSVSTEIIDLIIPEGVTNISMYAFKDCSKLASVTIPNSVTIIGEYAFDDTHLKSVTIGSGVLSIGSNAFPYTSNSYGTQPQKVIWLTNTSPDGYKNAEGTINYVANDLYTSLRDKTVYPFLSSMFEVGGIKYVPVSPSERTCDAIDCAYNASAENINIGNAVMYKGVEMKLNSVKDYVCIGNPFIKDVMLTYSGDVPYQAFYGCTGVQTATIDNDGYIGNYAFYGCSALLNVTITNSGNISECAFEGSMQGQPATIEVSNKGNIETRAFYGCTALQTATISNNGDIGTSAFEGSMTKSLATVHIYNKGNIEKNVFYGCSKLETATLGDVILFIGNGAFSNCSSLQNIIIPDAVTSLGTHVFSGCSSLTSACMGSGLANLPTYTFSDCSSLTNMQIGQNVKTIETYAFNNCSALETISIPQSVTDIKDNVFFGCTGLKNVTMEDRMDDTALTLGSNGSNPIFSSCPLDNVYIGRNISYQTSSSYGYSPFYRNTSLRNVTITDKETEISENEFYGCTNLKEVKIGDGVTTIGNRAFSGCSSLDYFAFGSAVKTIGQEAFSDCTAMTKLISKAATPPICGTQALDDINKWTCTLQVPASSLSLYQQASQWKEFFFIEGVTGIKNISGNSANKLTIKSSYDLNGKQFSQPQNGLNILKMSDGSTRKVVK